MGRITPIIVISINNYLLLALGKSVINKVIKLRQLVSGQEESTFVGESEPGMKYKISRILIVVIGVLFSFVMARKIYRFVRFGIPITLSRPIEPSITEFEAGASFPVVLNENDQITNYDFKGLVDLFGQCDHIKREFYTDFTPHFARKKEVDLEKVQEILKQLYQERARFAQYAAELKGQAQRGISLKKRRSLIYYQGVIQRHIQELERIKKVSQP